MQGKKLLKCCLATTLVFGSVTVMTSCGCKKQEEPTSSIKFIDLLQKNVNEGQGQVESKSGVTKYVGHKSFLSTEASDIGNGWKIVADYSENGLLVVKNDTNQTGFYSLHYQKYLIAPIDTAILENYTVYLDNNVGYLIKIETLEHITIYDSFGNKVFFSENDLIYENTKIINNEVYLTITEETSPDACSHYYKYLSNGHLEKVESLPQINNDVIDKEETSSNFGDIYTPEEKLDLSSFGLENRYLIKSNNIISVLDNNNIIVASFSIPSSESEFYIIGKNLFYQVFTTDSLEQDGNLMMSETYVIDLNSGEKNVIDFPYVIFDISLLKDENNMRKYALAYVSKMKGGNTETSESIVLINEEGKILEDVTKLSSPSSFIKIGNNYYNSVTKIIYNDKLQEVMHIASMNPMHLKEYEVFIGENNGKYGAINYNGQIVIPFVYDSLNPLDTNVDFKNNNILAKIGNIYYRVDKSSGERVEIGTDVIKIYEDLYMSTDETNETISFMSQSETYKVHNGENGTISLENIEGAPVSKKMNLNNSFGEYVVTRFETDLDETYYVIHSVKEIDNHSTFQTKYVSGGLYDSDGQLIKSWSELKAECPDEITSNTLYLNDPCQSEWEGVLVVDPSITSIHEKITSIYYTNEGITSLVIPDTVTNITVVDFSLFLPNLQTIIVDENNAHYSSSNGVLVRKNGE